jgi:hypothetical protein
MGDPRPTGPGRAYLTACSLALAASALSLAAPAPDAVSGEGLRPLLLVGALAAIGLFAWIAFGIGRSTGGRFSPDLPDRSASRLRKMTLLWLGLAAALGFGVLRAPFELLWNGAAGELSAIRWAAGAGGLGIAAAALFLFARALRQLGPGASPPATPPPERRDNE